MLDFLKKKNVVEENCLILLLQEGGGEAILCRFDKTAKVVSVLQKEHFSYSDAWERLVEDVDEVLYKLEEKAGTKADKCMIFIYSHFVDVDKKEIKQPYLDKINTISSEMGLDMVGFMECHEILFTYFSKVGAGVFSGIFCEIDESFVTIFVYRNGNLDLIKTIQRTDDYVDRLEEEFLSLSKTKTLPLRIVLYGIGSVDMDATAFMSKRWATDIFVQLPKVEVITESQMEEALLDNFKNQIFAGDSDKITVVSSTTQEINSGDQVVEKKIPKVVAGFTISDEFVDETPKTAVNMPVNYQNDNLFVSPDYKVPTDKPNRLSFLRTIKLGRLSFSGLLIILVGITLILSSIFTLLYSYHKADVTLLYDTKPITTKVTLSGQEVSMSVKTKEVKETDSLETTGVKFIGEKARGEIAVLNKDKKEVTIPKGATIIGPKNLKFILDSVVKIASASEELTSGGDVLTVTGKDKGTITASELGEEYNLAKDTKFEVSGFSSLVVATSSKAISGGSKKEVKTASKSDFDALKNKVLVKIKKGANQLIDGESGKRVVDSLTQVSSVKEEYSKEVAEEASELSLTMTGRVRYYAIDVDKTKAVLSNKLKKSVPQDQTLDSNAINFTVKSAKLVSGKPVLTLDVKGTPGKKVDVDEVKKMLKGKPISALPAITSSFQAKGYEYKSHLDIPILKGWLPLLEKNLTVSIKTSK